MLLKTLILKADLWGFLILVIFTTKCLALMLLIQKLMYNFMYTGNQNLSYTSLWKGNIVSGYCFWMRNWVSFQIKSYLMTHYAYILLYVGFLKTSPKQAN